MRILYGVQGTGHGHISRARVVLPKLREYADVDVLISGYNFKMNIDGPVDYTARGMSLAYDENGSVDFLKTALNINPVRFLRDVDSVPLHKYDFVVNDYEPVTAWAAKRAGMPCVAISHQAAFLSDSVPRPEHHSIVAEHVLSHFAPSTAAVASHYLRYSNFIEPPIIRRQVRALNPVAGDHVTVYLPAFSHHALMNIFQRFPQVEWQIFSPFCDSVFTRKNVTVYPVGKESFLKSIESCLGIVSAAGFETTSEALYLGKKLLVIPIKNQYEQACNAAALRLLGGKVITEFDEHFSVKMNSWLTEGKSLNLPEISDEDDLAQKIINKGKMNVVDEIEMVL
jgi:uncharacterized protein (TIGR00661 family)